MRAGAAWDLEEEKAYITLAHRISSSATPIIKRVASREQRNARRDTNWWCSTIWRPKDKTKLVLLSFSSTSSFGRYSLFSHSGFFKSFSINAQIRIFIVYIDAFVVLRARCSPWGRANFGEHFVSRPAHPSRGLGLGRLSALRRNFTSPITYYFIVYFLRS